MAFLMSDAPTQFGGMEALACVDVEAFTRPGQSPEDVGKAALKYVSEQWPGIAWSLNTAIKHLDGNVLLNA